MISSDRTRKALLGVAETTRLHDCPWQDAYSEARTDEVYAEVLRRAQVVLASGRSVVVDASFRSRATREQAQRLARALGVGFVFVECRVPIEVSRRRLRERSAGPSISDGREEILDAFLKRYEPIGEQYPVEHIIVESAGSLGESLAQLERHGLFSK